MVPLSDVTGQSPPVFTIQVVVSSVLLRGALMPGVRAVALISGGALAASLLLTALATNWLLLPLKRIERTIDRIVQQDVPTVNRTVRWRKNLAAVRSS